MVCACERCGAPGGGAGMPEFGGGGGAERIDWLVGEPALNDDDAGPDPFAVLWPSDANAPESDALPPDGGGGGPVTTGGAIGAAAGMFEEPVRCVVGGGGGWLMM